MSIQFSGVGSGLPINEWIDALVGVKQQGIDKLLNQQKGLETKNSVLNSLQSSYSALKSAATKLTDALMGSSFDIFSKTTVKTSETGEKKSITATATNLSTPSEFDIEVQSLATQSKLKTDSNDAWKNASSRLSDLGITGSSTLKINGAEISVSEDMSVDELVSKINNSSSAGVSAYLKGGTLVLENKETGAKDITVEGDMAAALGFDNPANKTLGGNAVYTLNGETKTSASNKLTSADTGIVGLNIELNSVTTEPVTVKITKEQDVSAVEKALEDFVNAYNKVIKDTDTQTAYEGWLYGESPLNFTKNNLRTMIQEPAGGGSALYKTLAAIGISTGAPGTSITADTTQLVFDKEKFKEAFLSDPEGVKSLLIGNPDEGSTGIMQKVKTTLEPALDNVSGYFKTRADSLGKEITNMTENISKKNTELETYRARLVQQYTAMDLIIAKLNQQMSQMQSQLSALTKSMDSSK